MRRICRMSVEDSILSVITNSFRIVVVWRFMRVFFLPRIEKYKEAIGYIVYFIVIMFVFLKYQYPLYNILSNWLGLLILTWGYKGGLKKKVTIATLIYMVNVFCDALAAYAFDDYMLGQSLSQIFSIFTTLFVYICEIIVERIVKDKGKSDIPFPMISLLLVPIVSCITLYFLLAANLQDRMLLMLESCGLLVINILLFVVYYQLTVAYEKQLEQIYIEEQMSIYENQLEVMQQSEQKVHSLRHDMKKHMQNIYLMTKNGQYTEVLQCLEDMQMSLENPKEYVKTGFVEVDGILNYLMEKGEKAGISMEYKVKITKKLSLKVYELNVLLRNLLDNAITAAKEAEKKYVSIHMLAEKDMLVVQIKNSYKGEIRTKGERILSTKTGKEHCIGLSIVKNLVESKHGTLQIEYDQKEFRVHAIIYL